MSQSGGVAVSMSLHQLLEDLTAAQQELTQVNTSLEDLTSRRYQLESDVDSLLFPPMKEIHIVQADLSQLADSIFQTTANAVGLRDKIKRLDECQSRTRRCASRVVRVLDLKNTIRKVEESFEQGKLKEAVSETHRALHLQKPIAHDVSYDMLVSLEAKLRDAIHARCEEAVKMEDFSAQLQLFLLLPYVGQDYEGVCGYCRAVRNIMAVALRKNGLTIDSQPDNAVVDVPENVNKMLDYAAKLMNQHSQKLQRSSGGGAHMRLLQDIYAEVDLHCTRLLQRFVGDKELLLTTQEVQAAISKGLDLQSIDKFRASSANSTIHNNNSNGDSVLRLDNADFSSNHGNNNTNSFQNLSRHDPRVINSLLEEVAWLCSEIESFDFHTRQLTEKALDTLRRAAVGKSSSPSSSSSSSQQPQQQEEGEEEDAEWRDDVEFAREHRLARVARLVSALEVDGVGLGLPRVSRVNEVAQELISSYITLEQYFMLSNVRKAVFLDELPSSVLSVAERKNLLAGDAKEGGGKELQMMEAMLVQQTSFSPLLPSRFPSSAVRSSSSSSSSSVASSGGGGADGSSGQRNAARRSRLSSGAAEEVQSATSGLTSTFVDDAFYILKKCTQRAFGTFSINACCAVVNNINAVLQTDMLKYFEVEIEKYTQQAEAGVTHASTVARLKASSSNQLVGFLTQSASQAHQQLQQQLLNDESFFVALNNINTSKQYCVTLKLYLESEFQKTFAHHPKEVKKLIELCLNDMDESTKLFRRLSRKGVITIARVMSISLNQQLSLLQQISYELSEADYIDQETNDPFVIHFITKCRSELSIVQQCLTLENFTRLVTVLAEHVVKLVEEIISNKVFTFWGGLQLDKDIRQLSRFFMNVHTVKLRDKFTKLTQIATVLSIEKLNEIFDYSFSQLNHNDIKHVLMMRKEFTDKEVSNLRLMTHTGAK